MIEFTNVQISYGRKTLVHSASFSAKNGAITVLLGRNGSGKSSLLRATVGAQRYSGEICLDGFSLANIPRRERATQLGYMPQILPAVEISVRELLLCGRAPHRAPLSNATKGEYAEIDAVLSRTGLLSLADSSVASLSGGERQRAYFAMLLVQDASNIVLDEPTANLDLEYRKLVYDFLSVARDAGKAVLVVMHNMSEACDIADRICVLQDGRISFDGPVSSYTNDLLLSGRALFL